MPAIPDPELEPGLYEELVDQRLRERIEALKADGRRIREQRVHDAEQPHLLARFVAQRLRGVLELVPPENRVEAANHLIEAARELASTADFAGLLDVGPTQLVEVQAPELDGVTYRRPQIPLGETDLLVNAHGEPALAHELKAEITSANEIDLLCAFVKFNGLRLVLDELRGAIERGVRVRVMTTTYVGVTERRAVDELVRIGAEVRICYETLRTRLHAKAWLFRRRSGAHTAYIGSSNLSHSAMIDGLEWNVRVSEAANASVITKFAATFDSYWDGGEFEPYDPATDGDRLTDALRRSTTATGTDALTLAGLDVRPYPFQQEILESLDTQRHVHDRWRNLVVAATGTGKTVVAALDYRRLRESGALGTTDPSLLFVAHRKEILTQSRSTFAAVLADGAFGELYVDGAQPERWRHVFASIQSLAAYGPTNIPAEHFDVVIVDEFHHAAAATYDALLSQVNPKLLLGLTATPERADGRDVTAWFDGHIAAELRLWDALGRDLLAPFHYFGVADNTDLTALAWRRGAYDVDGLEALYTGNDARVRLILEQLRRRVHDVRAMRALGFCVSQAHAHYMARMFNEAGIPARALDANTPRDERTQVRSALASGEISIIFTVDLFNEGVDIPAVDTVLFLRPTESATVFLQQLGRGLRHSAGKECLTVLDFVGQQHRSFRFDLRYRALTGATRAGLIRDLEEEFPFLPSGCSIQLDRVAQRIVLDNIRAQLRLSRKALVEDVRSYGDRPLADYLAESGRDLPDVYARQGSWTRLRREASLPTPPVGEHDDALLKRVHRFASVDDLERIDTWTSWLIADVPPQIASLARRQQRLAAMLFFSLWPSGGGHWSLDDGFAVLWRHPAVRAEIVELLGIQRERISHVPLRLAGTGFDDVPLWLHCRYSREELLTGLGYASLDRKPTGDMQGVRYVEDLRADVFTFTLQKVERDYSPTTMYRDYVMTEGLIHWESQNTTSVASPTGKRYLTHRDNGTHVLLFARETSEDDIGTRSFLFLGHAEYVSHEGSNPIAIVWRLRDKLPADFYSATSAITG